jgi:hypothetical protein
LSERVDNLDLGTKVLENTARNEEFIQKKRVPEIYMVISLIFWQNTKPKRLY